MSELLLITQSELMLIPTILFSALVGMAIGYARRSKSAGIRTMALISLGSCLFTIISINTDLIGADPARVIAQIVTGVGFIGAGVIWRHEGKSVGITTAAAIWVTASVGICIGLQMWFLALISAVLILIILYSGYFFKKRKPRTRTLPDMGIKGM
ncbi:MgtC/SapB family protein [Candidatus Micrarchaeota archaeon]|nr:MgtC/SapB family protein [Candidatus Micrarchaeota archaeon]